MSARDDGGPAFPQAFASPGNRYDRDHGMTLRDRFATEALGIAYAQVDRAEGQLTTGWRTVVQIAYVVADHMIAERSIGVASDPHDDTLADALRRIAELCEKEGRGLEFRDIARGALAKVGAA